MTHLILAAALNPLLMSAHWAELAIFVLAVAAVFGVFGRWVSGRIGAALVEPVRDIRELRHREGNARARLDALEARDTEKDHRITKVEVTMERVKEDLLSINTKLDRLIELQLRQD